MEAHLIATDQCVMSQENECPDVVVINTCTVTSSADRQARQLLRRVHREHPDAKIVVTGCYGEREPERLQKFEGVTQVLPITKQTMLPQVLGWEEKETVPPMMERFTFQTRAVLKMQDGCNAYCSFCVLPYVRGRSRSLPLSDLVRQAKGFVQSGHREIIVTGTHLGAYGRDLHPRLRFSDALRSIADASPNHFVRISSLEPTTLTPDFIRVVSERPNIRPHFHIPLQSGSDSVLRRMNRKYKVHHYRQRIEALAKVRETLGIGADVIAGFPGETEAEFNETVCVVQELPITYLHVFPYSPRSGTRASMWSDDVPHAVKKERVHCLLEIGRRKRRDFHSRFLGKTVPVLVEKTRDIKNRLTGYSPHYMAVRLEGPDRLMEREVAVRILSLEDDVAVGEIE